MRRECSFSLSLGAFVRKGERGGVWNGMEWNGMGIGHRVMYVCM